MSEFDNLKNEAEQLAQEHPDQVKEGEQFAEKEARTWPGRSSAARVTRTPDRAARTPARTSKPAAQPAPAARKACAITW